MERCLLTVLSCKYNILLQTQNAPKHIPTIIFGSLGTEDRPVNLKGFGICLHKDSKPSLV